MSRERDEQRTGRDGQREGGRKRRERQHDPIIVDGQASLRLEFDDTHEELYEQTGSGSKTQYTGTALVITTVTVTAGTASHQCAGVPSHGRCTIIISGRRAGKFDQNITVEGKDGEMIEIGLDAGEYGPQPTTGHRKKFGQVLRHVKSLTIIDNDNPEAKPYVCELIPNNGKCIIEIRDAHV